MLRIFYFSGTGNAKAVAHWLAQVWMERGHAYEVVDLSVKRRHLPECDQGDEIAVVSPTHGFNFPPITLTFLFHLPRSTHRNGALIFNTRAGARILGVSLPGLSGVAQILAALILLLKGYRVRVMRPIDLPSNWLSLHPGLRPANVEVLFSKCQRIVRRSAINHLNGKRDYRALYDLPIDLLIAPVSIAYYFIGRFLLAKSFFASRDCDSCGLCIKQCPISAIALVEGRPFWSYRCESCMRCMSNCPKRAVQTAHGFWIGFLSLLSALSTRWLYPYLEALSPAMARRTLAVSAVREIVEAIMMLVSLFAAYRLLHFSLRFRAIERIVYLTSLTHFQFWRRYRAPRIKS